MIEQSILQRQREFDDAELQGNRSKLQQLLTDDFVSIGPKGYLMNKDEWINRHDHFKYLSLAISNQSLNMYRCTAIIRNIQTNKAKYKETEVALQVRTSQVWIDQDGNWKLAAIQFSPIENM